MSRMKARIASAATALCLASVGATTAATAGETPALTWQDIELAARSHPALLAASSEVEEAAGAVAASRQYPNPVLSLGFGRAEALESPEEDRVWELELSLPLLPLGAYRGAVRAAAAERSAAAHGAAGVRLEVLRALKELFLRVAHDQERLEALEASAAQLKALVDVARLRVGMGEARPMELSRMEIEAARVDLEVAQAHEAARARREVLNLWLGSTMPADFRVQADLADLPVLPPLDEAVAAAVSTHPDVGSAEQLLLAATARLVAERWERFPAIEIGGFYEKELDSRRFGGALQVTLPLWNWNSGRIAKAKAAETTARHRRDVRLREIEAAAQESHAAAVSAYARARGFRDVILPRAVEVAAAMEKMYQVGEVDVMNVLDARRGLIEIESELLGAYLESQLVYLQLAALMGDSEND